MDGLNLVILILKKEDITKDSKVLSLILTYFRNVKYLLTIVITNCDNQGDHNRTQLVQLLKERNKNIVPLIEQRICTVRLPWIDKERMEMDVLKLHYLIEQSNYCIATSYKYCK